MLQFFYYGRRHYAEENGKESCTLSGTKHAHDIDFRRAKLKNELAEAIQLHGSRLVCVISNEEYAALEKIEERLDDLVGYMYEGIVMLDGKRWALAQECVNWATSMRDVNIQID